MNGWSLSGQDCVSPQGSVTIPICFPRPQRIVDGLPRNWFLTRVIDVTQRPGDEARGPRTRLQAAGEAGLLAAGAALLMCAPLLPGLARVVVLPALLLAPGYAFLRLLGHAAGWQSISLAIPVSIVLVICASLVLDVSGIRLGPVSLGLVLGAITVLFLAASYGLRLVSGRAGVHRRPPSGGRDVVRGDVTVGERR
jgi:hypothetical protein